jgi:hypothetical protein
VLPREIEALLRPALPKSGDAAIEVDAYFGRDPTGRHAAVSRRLFELVKAPLLRARFERIGASWQLNGTAMLDPTAIPEAHQSALAGAIAAFVAENRGGTRSTISAGPFSVAILHDGPQADTPSNDLALERFVAATKTLGMQAEIIDRHAAERLESFGALFIRDTTNPGHYTYEFARRAAAAGLVVIDDPDSVLQCNNKVYLHELFERFHIPMPKSALVNRDNATEIDGSMSFPCILKEPGSAFSRGVTKVESAAGLRPALERLLGRSDIVIAQEYIPTEFDWRVGVLDRRVAV